MISLIAKQSAVSSTQFWVHGIYQLTDLFCFSLLFSFDIAACNSQLQFLGFMAHNEEYKKEKVLQAKQNPKCAKQ